MNHTKVVWNQNICYFLSNGCPKWVFQYNYIRKYNLKTRFSKNKYSIWLPLHIKSYRHDNVNPIYFCGWNRLSFTFNSSFAHFWRNLHGYCPWKTAKYIQNKQFFPMANRYLLIFCLTLHIQNIVNLYIL